MTSTRRVFLSAAVGATLLKSQCEGQSTTTKQAVIDCHTHFYDPTRPQGVPWPAEGTPLYRTVLPEHLRAQPQYLPVTGTVVVEASRWKEDNQWLLDLAEKDPFILGVVGNLDPRDPLFRDDIGRFAENPLYRGIRISVQIIEELLASGQTQVLRAFPQHNLSLDINGGPHTPLVVSRLAKLHPDLRIIVNHIGNVEIDGNAPPHDWQQGMLSLRQHRNVFCKVSALVEGAARNGRNASTDLDYYRPVLDVVWKSFGAERLIYGSNWPVSDRAADYATLQRLAVEYFSERGSDVLGRFLSENSKRAYLWMNRVQH